MASIRQANPRDTISAGKTPESIANDQSGQELSQSLSPAQETGILEIYRRLQRSQAHLVGSDGESRALPASLHSFLAELLDVVGRGKPVSISQEQVVLGTIESSEILGVSRRFLIGLLEGGQIPFHRVGSHRRVYAQDLLQFKAKRDANRAAAIRGLAESEHREGLYDDILPVADDEG